MKRYLRICSLIMLVTFLFTTVTMYASENNVIQNNTQKTDEEMRELGVQYFPEYEEKIVNPNFEDVLDVRTVKLDDNLVINETRRVSETEMITYQEYASGRANLIFTVNTYTEASTSGSNYTYNVISIQVYSVLLSGSMYIANLGYTIYTNKYDKINSYGNTSGSSLAVNVSHTKSTENASGPATVTYTSTFSYPAGSFLAGQVVPCALVVEVGNNNITITAN